MTDRVTLTKRLMQALFGAWDIKLYLDTHPDDEEMAKLFEQYACKSCELMKQYEDCFGPLSQYCAYGEQWLKSPWPWDAFKGVC